MGLFITFEGCDGCGKSYQSKKLYRHLLSANVSAVLTHEPGGTVLGENITKWLKWHKELSLSATGELLLFSASRNQLCNDVIVPALNDGKVVISDRFYDSTIAYQGYGRGMGLDVIRATNKLATAGLKPKLTVLLDISAVCGLSRKNKLRKDRFETEELAFHEQVRQGYLQLARNEPRRFFTIDATLPKAEIADLIWQKVATLLPKANKPIAKSS